MARTIFLSIGHNNGFNWIQKAGKWIRSIYRDKGASGNLTTEFEVTKAIIDTIVKQWVPGCIVIKVPEGLNLGERIAWINARYLKVVEPFAFEFHLDSAVPTANGASVWYHDGNGFTLKEWKQFLAEFTNITGLKSRHVNADTLNRLGKLGFVRQTKCAALLIELGFITNTAELATIISKWADAITKGFVAMNKS